MKGKLYFSMAVMAIVTLAQLGTWILGLQAVYLTESLSNAKIWIGVSVIISILRVVYDLTIHRPIKKEIVIQNYSSS